MTQPQLILDLDETIIGGTQTRLDRPPDLEVDVYAIYKRPHLAEFLASVCPLFLTILPAITRFQLPVSLVC